MKRKIQIGDRVRVYGNSYNGKETNGKKATVVRMEEPAYVIKGGWMEVEIDTIRHFVHPRQCVRLTPKRKKRSVEGRMHKDFFDDPGGYVFRDQPVPHYIKVRVTEL